jgi:hypothetical protein
VYDKSAALYQPDPHPIQAEIVEGALDALSIGAAVRAIGLENRFRPVSTLGLGFSDSQIDRVLAMHPRAPVIALDGDNVGQHTAAELAARIALRGREAAIVTGHSNTIPPHG